MDKLFNIEIILEDNFNNLPEIHYIPNAFGTMEENFGNDLECLYRKEV